MSHADRIYRYRLLDKDMLSGFHRGPEVERSEYGRRGQDDQIDVACDDLFVGVEAGEHRFGGDLVDVFEWEFAPSHVGFDPLFGCFQVIREQIAHSNELDVGISLRAIDDACSASSATETDQTDFDLIVGIPRVKVLGAD